ncbi:SPOR domain-containing protein [Gammaproteobacteria bacterium]|jgi:cell division protein FtsN|nr:SPOR domain-containing protein [Gammaproteobacteria bacterium]
MAHDFAKQRSSSNSSKKKRTSTKSATKTSPAKSHWPWFFSGLLSGLFVALIGFLGVFGADSLQNINSTISSQDAISGDPNESTDFGFYTRLSEAEVVVDVVNVELEPEIEENPNIYRVQAGSFNVIEDAEKLRAEIILIGLDASISQAEVLGQTMYRVQAGPFVGNASADDAVDLLARNNLPDTIKIVVR